MCQARPTPHDPIKKSRSKTKTVLKKVRYEIVLSERNEKSKKMGAKSPEPIVQATT